MEAEDSGTGDDPIVYTAAHKVRTIISSGTRLDLRWEPHRNGVRRASVPTGMTTDQLFVSGQRQPMVRYPDLDPSERIFNGYAEDCYSPERAKRWADPRGGFIHAMHKHRWGDFH